MRAYFQAEILPVLTPLGVDPGRPFPHISNLSLNLAVIVRNAKGEQLFARVKVPPSLPRLLPIEDGRRFVWLEDVIAGNLDTLFPGNDVLEAYSFHVLRDADLEIQEDEAPDLLETIEEGCVSANSVRWWRLVVDEAMPESHGEHADAKPGGVTQRHLPLAPAPRHEQPVGAGPAESPGAA